MKVEDIGEEPNFQEVLIAGMFDKNNFDLIQTSQCLNR